MKRTTERGFTLVEIMIVVAIIALLAAIAIPNVLRGRTTANETASIGNMRALMSSLEMFRSVNNVYPLTANWQANMYTNATPAFGPPSFNNGMAGATVQGFNYTYVGTISTYTIDSVPLTPLTTGTRRFRASETGLVRHCTCPDVACAAPNWANMPTIDQATVNCA